jgi:hypothetical protein
MFVLNLKLAIYGQGLIYTTTLLLQLAFYGLGLFGLLWGSKAKTPLLIIPFYFCLENGAALFGIYKGIFNKQQVTWQKFSRKS